MSRLIEIARSHPLHATVLAFFLFVVVSVFVLENARYRHH